MSFFGHFLFDLKGFMTWSKAKVGTNVCFLSLITLKPEECLKNYLVKRYIAWLAFYPYKLPSGSPDQLPKIMFRIISILAWDVSAYAELTTHLMQMIHNHNRWFDHELVFLSTVPLFLHEYKNLVFHIEIVEQSNFEVYKR